MRPRVLFISYNSLIEPLGPTQIVPYLRALSQDFDITVLSFEKQVRSTEEDALDRAATRPELASKQISWIELPYHKSPSLPATLYDIARGIVTATKAHRQKPFDLIHARGYVPAAIALGVKKRTRVPYLFDIRGLQAEEYVDAGHWRPNGARFRITKWAERRVLLNADALVTLTEAIKPVVSRFGGLRDRAAAPPWSVIPSCVDLDHFKFDAAGRARVRAALNVGERPVLVYSGSIGTWYQVDEMIAFYRQAKERWPGLFFLALINRSPEDVADRLRASGVDAQDFCVKWVKHAELPAYLSAADAAIAFIRPCLSKLSSSPTKYAEYLACGLPFVANAGVGDVAELLSRHRCGALIIEHTGNAYSAAADTLRNLVTTGNRAAYRAVAEREFSLALKAYPTYRELYGRILARRPRSRILFLTPYPLHCAPSQRLKFEQYYSRFIDAGYEVEVSAFVTKALWKVLYQRGHYFRKLAYGAIGHVRRLRDFIRAAHYDLVYIHLWALPFGPPLFEEWLSKRGVPYVYDIDDLIYLPRASDANAFVRKFRHQNRIVRIMRGAAHVIVCTPYLREFARAHNHNVTLISSTVDTDTYRPRSVSQAELPIVVGWTGSHSTSRYLRLLKPALAALALHHKIRLLVIGDAAFTMEGVDVEARPWNLEREVADISEMDIGVYPLPEEEWILGKSGLKALQYMGAAVPVVASRIGVACGFIRDGENGFLASTTEEWVDRLAGLITSPALRRRVGLAGRTTVEERYSVRVNASKYLEVLHSAQGSHVAVASSVEST